MCTAVSACLALRISRSRASPEGVPRASFRRRFASSVNRSASDVVCLNRRRRCMRCSFPCSEGGSATGVLVIDNCLVPCGDVQQVTLPYRRCRCTSAQLENRNELAYRPLAVCVDQSRRSARFRERPQLPPDWGHPHGATSPRYRRATVSHPYPLAVGARSFHRPLCPLDCLTCGGHFPIANEQRRNEVHPPGLSRRSLRRIT